MLWLVRRSLVDAQRHAVCALHRAWILRDIQTTYCSPITQYTTRACYACACSATSNEQPAPPIVAPPPPQPLNIYQPAKPGTVKMYDYHFFIRNPTRMAGAVLDYLVLWPPAVERYGGGCVCYYDMRWCAHMQILTCRFSHIYILIATHTQSTSICRAV